MRARLSAALLAVTGLLGVTALLAVTGLLAVPGLAVATPPARAANPVAIENSKPGDSAWLGAITAHVGFGHPAIAGYASATSVRPGEALDLYVNVAQPGRYRVEIVRLGWYGGLGGRRLTCLVGSTLDPGCTRDEPGVQQQPAPAPDRITGEVQAPWSVTDHLRVPLGWVSGYYLAIFRLTAGSRVGETGFTPFVVQAPAGDRARILVQVPTNTWQAYNIWGGESLYTSPRATKVSFNRPYQNRYLFQWEYPLVRFLERRGYDVSYATDDDVDREPGILLAHQLDIVAGHGEYWTGVERNAWDAARAHGINLAFIGANTGYWQVRYEHGYRTMVSYKSRRDPAPNPSLKTVQFRALKPARPECQLLGAQYIGLDTTIGQYFSYAVTRTGASDPWLSGTGLRAGSRLKGTVGFEFDSVQPRCHVPPVTVLLRWGAPPSQADAVRYRACSGAEVFDAGSLSFSWGLDAWRDPQYLPPLWPPAPADSPGLQRMMTNAIGDMLVAHPRLRAARALRVIRGGRYLRFAPGAARARLSVRWYGVGPGGIGGPPHTIEGPPHTIEGPHALSWRVTAGQPTVALIVEATVRTGDVLDSSAYLVRLGRDRRVVGSPQALSAASCDGASARVLTPVLGASSPRRLEVAAAGQLPLTVTVSHDRRRVALVRAGRRTRSPFTIGVPAVSLPCGRLSLTVADRDHRFRLAAIKSCPPTRDPPTRDPPARESAAIASVTSRPWFHDVPGSPFVSGSRPTSVAFNPAGNLLASADAGLGAVSVLRVARGPRLVPAPGSPYLTSGLPDAVAFSPSGRLLAAVSNAGDTVSMFSVAGSGALSIAAGSPYPTGSYPTSLAFSPSGGLLAITNYLDYTVSVFAVAADGRLTPVAGSPYRTGSYPTAVAFDPTGGQLAVASYEDGTVALFAVGPDGTLAPSGPPVAVGGHPSAVAYGPGGRQLAVAGSDELRSTVSMFALSADGQAHPQAGSPYAIGGPDGRPSLAFSPTGTVLASAEPNRGTVSVLSVAADGRLATLTSARYAGSSQPLSPAFDPSGGLLAVANFGSYKITLLSSATPGRREIRARLARHLSACARTGFTPPAPGRVAIAWYAASGHAQALATARARITQPGPLRLRIKLTRRGELVFARMPALRVLATASFVPRHGRRVIVARRLVLTRAICSA